MTTLRFFLALSLLGLLTLTVRADDAQLNKEARLRDALKNAYALLRTAQDQAAALQAAQAESDKEKEALKTQVQTLTDQLKAETTKSELTSQTLQAQRDQLKLQGALLQRRVDNDETRNIALFRLGNEILTRYEKFSLGEALSAKEPFTQLTRVKLENLVQDYQDKLGAQRIGATPPPAATTTAANSAIQPSPAPAAPETTMSGDTAAAKTNDGK